jgi:hypothetical protein
MASTSLAFKCIRSRLASDAHVEGTVVDAGGRAVEVSPCVDVDNDDVKIDSVEPTADIAHVYAATSKSKSWSLHRQPGSEKRPLNIYRVTDSGGQSGRTS